MVGLCQFRNSQRISFMIQHDEGTRVCVCVIKIEFVTQDADVWSCLRSRRVSGLCKCFCSSAPDRQQHLLTAVTNSVAVTLKVVHAKQLFFFVFFLRTVPVYISLNPTQSCSVKVPGTVFHYWIPICMWEHKRVNVGQVKDRAVSHDVQRTAS